MGPDPDEAHAGAPRALTVAPQRIADKRRRLRPRVERGESDVEDRGIGLLDADAVAVDHDREQRGQTGALAHRFEVAVEVGDDAEPVAPPERREDRPVARESGRGLRQKTRCDAFGALAVRPFAGAADRLRSATARELAFEIGNQRTHRPREVGSARQASDQRVVGREKAPLEHVGWHVQAFGAVECVKAFLPRHAVGVERSAEIE